MHSQPEKYQQGGVNTEKMGVCAGGLRGVFHRHATGGVFCPSLYTYNALLSAFDKVPFSHFPYYWFIISSRVYNHIVVVYWKFVEFHYCIILIVVLYILLTIYE